MNSVCESVFVLMQYVIYLHYREPEEERKRLFLSTKDTVLSDTP